MTGTPAGLTWAVRLLYGEAAALTAVVAWLVWADLAADKASVLGALLVTLFAVGAAAVLWAVARSLGRRRGAGRGAAVVAQLMWLAVGYYLQAGDLPLPGLVVMGYALVTAVLLCLPSTTKALGLERGR